MYKAKPLSTLSSVAFFLVSSTAMLLASSAHDVMAKPNKITKNTKTVTPAPLSKSRTYTLTLKQLGVGVPLTLHGVESFSKIPFNIRADEVVVSAKLKLVYSYSPALIPETSHIAVLVNGEVARTIELPKIQSTGMLMREIALDPSTITEFNTLNLKFIGHYTDTCEDPMHSSLWATISNQSTLEIKVAPIALDNDLALLPAPFFDRRDSDRLTLPFVFGAHPSLSTLEAAGTVASWFGKLATYRGARFDAQLNQLPPSGNAVLFATTKEIPAGITLPEISGPTLVIVNHPNDSSSKILLVLGRTGDELKQAAQALTLDNRAMNGVASMVRELPVAGTRVPYDAPNWISTEHPVPLGDLATPEDLTTSGYYADPVRVNLRLPPDLFVWGSKGVPLNLKYRFTPRPTPDKSTLDVDFNEQFIESIKLPAVAHQGALSWFDRILPATNSQNAKQILIPPYDLSHNGQLQFKYRYEYLKEKSCTDTIIQNVNGTIDADSNIDITSLPHFIEMPNLAVFVNNGFPFTRMADLSNTVVVLPATVLPAQVSAYLGLMGRMGESTGYPATGVKLALPSDVQSFPDKDFLVIGSERDQPLFTQWRPSLPFLTDGQDQQFMFSSLVQGARDWWDNLMGEPPRTQDRLTLRQAASGPLLMGFESPLHAGRSVVALQVRQDAEYAEVVEALLDPENFGKVHGSAVSLHGKQIITVDDAQSYEVGRLPLTMHIRWWLSSRPWILALFAVICACLSGMIAFLVLRKRATDRLS